MAAKSKDAGVEMPKPKREHHQKPRKTWSEAEKEKARAVYATTGSYTEAMKAVGATSVNTVKPWILDAKAAPKVQEAREEAQVRFVREAWASIMDGLAVARKRMGFILEDSDKIDRAFEAVCDADLLEKDRAQILKSLATLSNISLSEVGTFNGIHIDKIRLLQEQPTGITKTQVDGQVRHEHEHSLTLKQVIEQRRGVAGDGAADRPAADDPLPALLRRGASITR